MPPSSDHDTPSISTVSPSKSKSKASAGGQLTTKASRKNGQAKESGITQAVKLSASKMPPKPSPPTAAKFPSTDLKPPTPANAAITSPLLDALSEATFSSAAQATGEWAKNVQALSASPSNLINLGESPPVLPSSYEDNTHVSRWIGRDQESSSSQLPSVSPPTGARRRPLSFQMDPHLAFNDGASVKGGHIRRGSVYSPPPQAFGLNPPLPHQPQAHFYGAPNFGLPLASGGMMPGEDGYHFGFDTLILALGNKAESQSVVVTGYQGGLDVFSVSKHGLEKLYSLTSLRGGVYGAKMLGPALTSSSGSPLVAVIVHGPVPSDVDDEDAQADPAPGSVRNSPRGVSPANENPLTSLQFYQTTVEVYALETREHVATLLTLPVVPPTTSALSPLFKRPPPTGALSLQTSGDVVLVASGTTGEVWIYVQTQAVSGPKQFDCVGKIWTSIQYGFVGDTSSSANSVDGENPHSDTSNSQQQPKAALLSLSNRWLAYCPPAASSQHSLRAVVPCVRPGTKVPGLNGLAPPHVPSINCATDIPQGESLLNRVTREGIQEVIKGAKWVGDQGMQAFKNYWNKSSGGQSPATPPSGSGQYWQASADPNGHHFPPTHGTTNQQTAVNADPTIVSILDIERLLSYQSTSSTAVPAPLISFKAPLGCSFLSFAPNGLMLFTASSKGDVQFIWDLMRVQYTKSSLLQIQGSNNSPSGPHVRQVASFTRMTVARIVDVVWTEPHGDRLAFVSERGTVHILDLPTTAFVWPPARRNAAKAQAGDPSVGRTAAESTALAAGAAMTAVSSAFRNSIARPRRSSGAGQSSMRATSMTAQAGHGGKVIAAGISKSFGAATGTLENIRYYGENRVHLPQNSGTPAAGCVRWLKGKRKDTIAVLGNGTVRIHTLRPRRSSVTVERLRAPPGPRYLDFKLPALPPASLTAGALELDAGFDLNDTETTKAKLNRLCSPISSNDRRPGAESSIPQAEIESNAPYQPFHTDRRVGLSVYASTDIVTADTSSSEILSVKSNSKKPSRSPSPTDAWAFGRPISATRLDLGFSDVNEDQDIGNEDGRALPASAIERVLTYADPDGDGEQLVVTTRRRKRGPRDPEGDGIPDDEGFFEDDCEVLDFASQRV